MPGTESMESSFPALLQVVETMNSGLLVLAPDGRIRFANERIGDWLQRQSTELLDQNITILGQPDLREALASEQDSVLAGDARARLLPMRRADGTAFPALVIPQRALDVEGNLESICLVVVELSTIQTAKRIGVADPASGLLSALEAIAVQLHQMGTQVQPAPAGPDLDHEALRDVSRREREVLELLLHGERVPAIAETLFISEHTVRNHLKSMFRKTGTSSQSELISWVRKLD